MSGALSSLAYAETKTQSENFGMSSLFPNPRNSLQSAQQFLETVATLSFLKRKLVKLEQGIGLVPGTNVPKRVENFENLRTILAMCVFRRCRTTAQSSCQMFQHIFIGMMPGLCLSICSWWSSLPFTGQTRPFVLCQGAFVKDGSAHYNCITEIEESHWLHQRDTRVLRGAGRAYWRPR